MATDSQVALLLDLAAEFGHRGERGRLWLAEHGDKTPVERLTRAQASELIERLLGMRKRASSHHLDAAATGSFAGPPPPRSSTI